MKVLIVKISSMGDIIHTLPAVTDAASIIPDVLFDWVVEETFSEIPQWHPSVHQIFSIKLRSCKKQWYKFSSWKKYYKCIKLLQQKKYDIIIDAQGLLKTSLLITCVTRGKKHGMDYTSIREPISCWVYNKRHNINIHQHAIERIRQLFAYSLGYLKPSYIGKYNIKHLFPRQPQIHNNVPYLIFLHATTRLEKNWPEFNWNFVIQHAIALGYYVKLPVWTINEKICAQRLAKHCDHVIILPKLTLRQIAIQMSRATAIISVDTGLSHLAAALDCPNLTLYGPTNPKLIGTYGGSNQTILYSPTKKMEHLTATYVWEIFHEILNMNHFKK